MRENASSSPHLTSHHLASPRGAWPVFRPHFPPAEKNGGPLIEGPVWTVPPQTLTVM